MISQPIGLTERFLKENPDVEADAMTLEVIMDTCLGVMQSGQPFVLTDLVESTRKTLEMRGLPVTFLEQTVYRFVKYMSTVELVRNSSLTGLHEEIFAFLRKEIMGAAAMDQADLAIVFDVLVAPIEVEKKDLLSNLARKIEARSNGRLKQEQMEAVLLRFFEFFIEHGYMKKID